MSFFQPTFTDRYGGEVSAYGKTIQRYKTRDNQTIQISMLNEEKFLKVSTCHIYTWETSLIIDLGNVKQLLKITLILLMQEKS